MICEGLQWRYWLDKRVSKVSAVTTVLWILDDCQRQCLSLDMFRLSHTQVACLYQLTYIKSHVTSDDYQLPDRSHRAVYRVLFLNWTPVRGQPPTVMAGSAQMLGAQPIAPGNWCFHLFCHTAPHPERQPLWLSLGKTGQSPWKQIQPLPHLGTEQTGTTVKPWASCACAAWGPSGSCSATYAGGTMSVSPKEW